MPSIVKNGIEWFASMGTEKSKGYTIYSLSGHVKRPASTKPARHHAAPAARLGGGMREGSEFKFWTLAARPRRS